MSHTPILSPRIGFISLGCPKATVDSERILTQLRAEGYLIKPLDNDVDLVVINTCGFIEAAIDESCMAIADAIEQHERVIVTGCLGARAEWVRQRFPEVLAVTGPHALAEVMAAVHAHLPAPHDLLTSLLPAPAVRLTPAHYAYLKISEGCDHQCSFCIIPDLRGGLVSRRIGAVLAEATRLVDSGVREILVIAQDTGAYGVDLRHSREIWRDRALRTDVTTLARELGELPAWIRLHYVYPYPHVDDLIDLMADGVILPYLDMPLQHSHERVLRAMRRPAAAERMLTRLTEWRARCPDLVVRSTFIVGFPGETDAEFSHLLDFLREAQLDRVGCFPYSPVDGARANALPDPVPEAVKLARVEQLMQVQADISREKLARRVGQRLTVLVDAVEEDAIIARSAGDAPEIDGEVIIPGAWEIAVGDFIEVVVTDSDAHDLWALPVDDDV